MNHLPNILAELKAIAPVLSNLLGDNPFRVPDNYFVGLHQRILTQSKEVIALGDIAPQLSEAGLEQPLSVPTGYFEQLHQSIMAKVAQESKTDIEEINDGLVSIPKTNPFSVPKNYFHQLPLAIQASLKNLEQEENHTTNADNLDTQTDLTEISKVAPFSIPNNYFDNLHSSIMDKVQMLDNQEQEEEASFSADISKINPFSVPNNYFADLESNILDQVQREEETTNFDEIAQQSPYTTPPTYFEQLHQSVMARIAEEDEATSFDDIAQQNPYTVPDGYFADLHQSILAKTKKSPLRISRPATKDKTKVRKMQPAWTIQRTIRYAMSIAAAFAILFMGLYVFQNDDQTDTQLANDSSNPNKSIAIQPAGTIPSITEVTAFFENLSAADAQAYINDNMEEFEDILEGEEFLEDVDVDALSFADMGIEISAEDLLNELLSEELEAFPINEDF